jgi:endothelin-converting enzyme
VSAGIITDPFYNDQVPDYLNFGGLGLVVGHELTHAFDNKGRVFNGDGKLDDWWTQSTALQFRERSKCFVNQYWNFTATDGNGKVYHTNGNVSTVYQQKLLWTPPA